MRKILILTACAALLAGCGGALDRVPKLADVPVAEGTGQAAALGGAAAAAPEPAAEPARGGLLGFLRGRADARVSDDEAAGVNGAEPEAADGAAALVAEPEAADGAADLAAEQAPDAAAALVVAAQPAAPRRGFLGLFAARKPDAAAPPAAAPPVAATQTASAEASVPAAEGAPKPRRAGLSGLLSAGGGTDTAPGDDRRQAALPPETQSDTAPKRSGWFGRRGTAKEPKPGAPDYEQVGPGVTLPVGKIARLCGVPVSRLGRKVDKAPARGRGFVLHDSAPGSTAARTFFLSGFDDGCARQFTAALVLLSGPESYEQIRYGASGRNLPKSSTDDAYDRLKAQVCGVAAPKPCGAKLPKLARDTVFVSIYERYGSNPRWKTLLLHDGEVLALDVKTSN